MLPIFITLTRQDTGLLVRLNPTHIVSVQALPSPDGGLDISEVLLTSFVPYQGFTGSARFLVTEPMEEIERRAERALLDTVQKIREILEAGHLLQEVLS